MSDTEPSTQVIERARRLRIDERVLDEPAATVDVTEPLGKEQMIYFSFGDETYIGSVSGHRNIPEGGIVNLRFPTDRVHLFDHVTGESILNCELPEDEETQQFNAAGGEGAMS